MSGSSKQDELPAGGWGRRGGWGMTRGNHWIRAHPETYTLPL